ncbi:hypothetical protein CDD81_7800 [Ophiocordyceps australis]|uniref:Uncharacterized protein n=1 Tax=Ophiocordyceps australis TaxID=1399860 RepID=A0A2C5Y3S1_9HYPO|nr:hypothetical protein CDD81_7800 [Ophiocordyceps australis]
MDSGEGSYRFKETRLNLEPPALASVVVIRVPSKVTNPRSLRRVTNDPSIEDEALFRLKNLAVASSIFHRKWHDAPRSFLWRVLDHGTVLSVRAVDVCKRDKKPDASLVLNFTFAVPIQPGCVAFADPQEHDALCVFVLDQASQLYTFTLRPDLFRRKTAIDAGLSELGKVQSPANLGFRSPHRLVAVSTNVILVTVNDGGIIRLDKTRSEDSSDRIWTESFFNVQGWAQNLRSLLPFHGKHTIKYGNSRMEYSAATSIQVTDFGLDDGLFAITVCIDHKMRIWNLEDGQIIYTSDILGAERPPQEMGKWTIEPSQANLVQLVGKGHGSRICATYSPIGLGEFKFWKISVSDMHTVVVEDLFPQNNLYPPTPSSLDIWTLADFVLASPTEGIIHIWTLWKNNMTYRVQRMELDRKQMARPWEESWDGVFSDTGITAAQTSGPCDPIDVTEKWLQTLFQPGRFTKATLETALSIYERGLGSVRDGTKGRSLAESICSILGSTISLERDSSGIMNYEQFRASSEAQWRRFYRLLIELDRLRGEAIGLSVDPETDLVWVVCTDLISAITECNELELLYHNLSSPEEDKGQLASLVSTALSFVDGFADSFVQMCNAALKRQLFEESSKTNAERILLFSENSGFWRGVTDEDCSQVETAFGTNFQMVTDDLYQNLLDLMAAPQEARRRHLRNPLTEFGNRLIMKSVQDSIELQWKVCLSQLILLVHMELEFDNEDEALHKRVKVGLIFQKLVHALKRLELLRWLARTELSVPLFKQERGTPPVLSKKGTEETQVVTALEANVGHLLGFDSAKNEPMTLSIMELVANLCAPDSDIEVSPALIQCSLVKRERADLALELAPFCDQSPFSVYIQGRVLLALRDLEAAAISFGKAAIGMSSANATTDRHSCGLLDDTEWNLLHSGVAKYYAHIVALYEGHRAHSYVLEFSRLALQFATCSKEHESIRTEMLSPLFNAALATAQFELAHTSLLSIADETMRLNFVRKLVDKMCETFHNTELVSLPFPGMQQEVEHILTQRCKNTMDVLHGFPYHHVLYAWRIKRNNYRGAASVILDRIHKLKRAGEGDRVGDEDALNTPVTRQYLLLINALSCVDAKQAWIFDEGVPQISDEGEVTCDKRTMVSLADIRRQYQGELDRISAIHKNQFGFEMDDVMDIA